MIFPDYVHGKDNTKNMVAIKTFKGKYLCAENGGGSTLTANREEIGEWETFQIIDLGKGYVALRSYNGDYISVSDDGKDIYVDIDDDDEIDKRQAFQLIKLDNNKVAFKTYNKTYLCAEDGGGGKVVGDRKKIGDWETFELVKIQEVNSDKYNLTAIPSDKNVTFTWTKTNDSKNIIGYNLYRGTASSKQSNIPITDFPIEGTSYTDMNIENNTTYYYIVKTVYRDKTLGEGSNEVSIKSSLNNKNIVLEVGSKYMFVNGQRKEIDPGKGTIMIIKNGRTFLPIRAVIESMGGEVEWNQSDKRVSIYLKNKKIHLWIGEKSVEINGSYMESDVAPYISDSGRTMLPLRFIVENLNCDVDWDGITKKVTIKTNN